MNFVSEGKVVIEISIFSIGFPVLLRNKSGSDNVHIPFSLLMLHLCFF